MIHSIVVALEDPMTDLAIAVALALIGATIYLIKHPNMLRRVRTTLASERGSAQLAQQSYSLIINILLAAAAVALVAYGVLQIAWTEICSNNLTQIAAAEDLRFARGYGYTTNGDVTAAAFVDSDGNNDYEKVTPGDWAATKGSLYQFTDTVTNGDHSYVIADPTTASHAAWSLRQFTNAASGTIHLQYVGPGGNVQAHT